MKKSFEQLKCVHIFEYLGLMEIDLLLTGGLVEAKVFKCKTCFEVKLEAIK